jgi:hypothetical protein
MTRDFVRRLNGCLWLTLAGALPLGCGSQTYEARLENTRQLFAHVELLDTHLYAAWKDSASGIQLRVPRQFTVLEPPAPPEESEQGKAAPLPGENGSRKNEGPAAPREIIDERQPRYHRLFDAEFPGLRGAFRASVKVLAPNGALSDGDCYLYVVSNHHLADNPEAASAFHSEIIKLLESATKTAGKTESSRAEEFPSKPGSFVKKKVKYESQTMNAAINGLDMQVICYQHTQENVRTALVLIRPRDVDSSEKLAERIPLCLETLEVTGDRLAGPSGNAGAPGGKATGF